MCVCACVCACAPPNPLPPPFLLTHTHTHTHTHRYKGEGTGSAGAGAGSGVLKVGQGTYMCSLSLSFFPSFFLFFLSNLLSLSPLSLQAAREGLLRGDMSAAEVRVCVCTCLYLPLVSSVVVSCSLSHPNSLSLSPSLPQAAVAQLPREAQASFDFLADLTVSALGASLLPLAPLASSARGPRVPQVRLPLSLSPSLPLSLSLCVGLFVCDVE